MSLNILGKSIIVASCEIVLFVCGAQTSKSTILKPLLTQRNTCCKFSLLIPTWKHPDVQESSLHPTWTLQRRKWQNIKILFCLFKTLSPDILCQALLWKPTQSQLSWIGNIKTLQLHRSRPWLISLMSLKSRRRRGPFWFLQRLMRPEQSDNCRPS